jgi:uncharacterized protein (DUF2147 family)
MKLLTPLLLVAILCEAQPSIVGRWKTVDDESGEVKSIVEIAERKGTYYGKIVQLFASEDPDLVCEKCPLEDERYGKKIIGMEILKGLKKAGDEYSDGNILDPEVGRIYRCTLWVEGHALKVRGYWGPFYRTQTWKKST